MDEPRVYESTLIRPMKQRSTADAFLAECYEAAPDIEHVEIGCEGGIRFAEVSLPDYTLHRCYAETLEDALRRVVEWLRVNASASKP